MSSLTDTLGRVAADGRYAGRTLMAVFPIDFDGQVEQAFLVLAPCPGCDNSRSMVAHIGSQSGVVIGNRSFDTAPEAMAWALEWAGWGIVAQHLPAVA